MELFDLSNLDPGGYKTGEVNARAGKASLEYLDFAIAQVMNGQADAIVFAPLNKLAMSLGGSDFKDEHSYFARHTKAELHGEINALDPFFTSRVTSHIGFRDIFNRLNPERILKAIHLLHQTMIRAGIQNPKIGVAALNPHGGEKGLFGRFSSYAIEERYLLAAARYVEMNPVRAGFVQRPEEYGWSSAAAHMAGRDDVLVKAAPFQQLVGDWGAFLSEAVNEEGIMLFKRHERTGRPLGSQGFVVGLEKSLGRRLLKQAPGPKRKNGIRNERG